MLAAFLILLLSSLNVMRSAEGNPGFHNPKTAKPSDSSEESDEDSRPSILDSVMTTLSTKAMRKKIQPTSTSAANALPAPYSTNQSSIECHCPEIPSCTTIPTSAVDASAAPRAKGSTKAPTTAPKTPASTTHATPSTPLTTPTTRAPSTTAQSTKAQKETTQAPPAVAHLTRTASKRAPTTTSATPAPTTPSTPLTTPTTKAPSTTAQTTKAREVTTQAPPTVTPSTRTASKKAPTTASTTPAPTTPATPSTKAPSTTAQSTIAREVTTQSLPTIAPLSLTASKKAPTTASTTPAPTTHATPPTTLTTSSTRAPSTTAQSTKAAAVRTQAPSTKTPTTATPSAPAYANHKPEDHVTATLPPKTSASSFAEITPPTTEFPTTQAPTNQSPTSTIAAVRQFTLQSVGTTSTQAAPVSMMSTPVQRKPTTKAPKRKHSMKIFREGENSKHADLETKKQELPKAKEPSKTEREDFVKHQAKLNSLNRELDYRARTLEKLLSHARISHGDRLLLEELKGKLENARNLEDIAEKENAIMEYQKILANQGVKILANNGKFNEDQAHHIAKDEIGHQKLEDALDRLTKVLSGEGFRNDLHNLSGLTGHHTQHHIEEEDFDESVGEDDDYEDHEEYFLILEDFLASFPVPVPIPIPVPLPF